MNAISLSSSKLMEQQKQDHKIHFTIQSLMLNKFLQMDEIFFSASFFYSLEQLILDRLLILDLLSNESFMKQFTLIRTILV